MIKPGSLSQGGFIAAMLNMNIRLQDEKLVIASSGTAFVDGTSQGAFAEIVQPPPNLNGSWFRGGCL